MPALLLLMLNISLLSHLLSPACAAAAEYSRSLPLNFLSSCTAPTGRAKCCDSGREIAKGEARLVLRILSCDGSTAGQKIYHPASAAATAFLSDLMGATTGLSAESIASRLANAPEEHRAWVADALRGDDVSGRPVPVTEVAAAAKKEKKSKPKPKKEASEASEAPASAKKRKLAEPAAEPAAKSKYFEQDDEDEEEDGELVD